VNPDTGEAETPVHQKALYWRRNLDNLLRNADRQQDREWEAEEKIAAMTPEQKDDMLKKTLLAERGEPGNGFASMRSNEVYEAKPNMRSPIMQALASGRPLAGELGRRTW
jgi:hypothetical protein